VRILRVVLTKDPETGKVSKRGIEFLDDNNKFHVVYENIDMLPTDKDFPWLSKVDVDLKLTTLLAGRET